MQQDNSDLQLNPSSKIMIVDDDRTSRHLLRSVIAKQFDVVTCASGLEALSMLNSIKPDLILLDVGMPDIDGFETCRKIRQQGIAIPIIFVTSHQSLEEHISAYDAGGDDLITKPVDFEILLRKSALAARKKSEKDDLVIEAQTMRTMAMNFLSSAGENGVLLNFMRKGIKAKSHQELAKYLVEAISEFGVNSSVMLRHGNEQTIVTSHGEPSQLEQSILNKMYGMGRLFQFHRQFIVNYDFVSSLVTDLQNDSIDRIDRIRDNVAILTETAEALCENVFMRRQSASRAEQMQIALFNATSSIDRLRGNHQQLLLDVRILLQELTDNVDSTFSWLGISHKQEAAIDTSMSNSIEKILALLSTGDQFDGEISKVLANLRGNNVNDDAEFW